MMDGESEMDDFMLEPEVMEDFEILRIRSKAPPVEGEENSRGRLPRSYNRAESQRNKSPMKTRSVSPVLQIEGEVTTEDAFQVWSRVSSGERRPRSYSSAESPKRRKSPLMPRNSSAEYPDEVQETQETPESKPRAPSGRGRPRSHSSVESPRNKSPMAPQSTSPKIRRSIKKGYVGGDGNDYSKSNGSGHGRRRGSLGSVGSSQLRERNSGSGHSRRTGGSSHGSSQIRERLLGNTGSDSSQKGTNNIRERLLGSTNTESNRPGSSHGRLASRRNLVQSTHDQSPENKEEKDQLSDSTRSVKKIVGATLPSSTGPRISWKSDPRASFCDWRIEVVHLTNNGEATDVIDVYNIHRNIVGFGPRKSNFMCKQFMRQMEDRNYAAGSNITNFRLPSWQADAFPVVMDFIYYTSEMKQKLTADKACSVFLIAEMLEVPPLEDAIENFYRKTLSLKNLTEFLGAATRFNADRLLAASRVKLGSLVMEKPELAGLVRPKFMIDLLNINKEQVKEIQEKSPESYPEELRLSQSRIWSRAAYVCAMHNAKQMNKEIFDAMMDEECLPAIDPKVALKVLMLDATYDPDSSEYGSLQRRCIESITENWEVFSGGYSSPEELKREIQKLPSPILNDILLQSMDT